MTDSYICKAPLHGLNITPFGVSPCCSHPPLVDTNDITRYIESDELRQLKLQLTGKAKLNDFCLECIRNSDNTVHQEYNYESDDSEIGLRNISFGGDIHCGFECVMCFSNNKKFKTLTAIGTEHFDYVVPFPSSGVNESLDATKIIDDNIDTLKVVTLLGGDPSLNRDTGLILDRLKDTNVEVRYFHNTDRKNLISGGRVLDNLKSLNNVKVILSNDGPGEISAYQRRGYDESKFMECLKEYSDVFGSDRVEILFSLTNINVLRMGTIAEYFSDILDKGYVNHIGSNHVIRPRWYSANCLPFKLKKQTSSMLKGLLDNHHNPAVRNIITQSRQLLASNLCRPGDFNIFMLDMMKLDKFHGTDILTLNPELKPYWSVL